MKLENRNGDGSQVGAIFESLFPNSCHNVRVTFVGKGLRQMR